LIFIKTLTGKTLSLDVESTDKILSLKSKIQEREGVPVHSQRILFAGKELDDSKSISECGVQKEGIVHLVLKKEVAVPVVESKSHSKPKSLKSKSSYSKESEGSSGSGSDNEGVDRETEAPVRKSKTTVPIVSNPVNYPEEKATLSEEKKATLLSSFAGNKSTAVEIVFCFDTTGSMSSVLGRVRAKLTETVTRLLKDIPKLKIGIIAVGDYCDQDSSYVLKKVDLTADMKALLNFVNNSGASGGGDAPEAYELGLREAKGFSWTQESSKALVVIGDEVPHPPSFTTENIDWFQEVEQLSNIGVKIYGVRALNNAHAVPFYEELSSRTGTVSINFNDFNLIVDMFLAICYREASPSQLEKFKEEVQENGKMTAEMKTIFETLAKPNPEKQKPVTKSNDYKQTLDWYNLELSKNNTPQFAWDNANNKWVPYTGSIKNTSTPTTSYSSYSTERKPTVTSKTKEEKEETTTSPRKSKRFFFF